MTLALVGLSHHDVDLRVLERVASEASGIPGELVHRGAAEGAVLLSTCNRVELYLDAEDPDAALRAAGELVLPALIGTEGLAERLNVRVHDAVARHLFSVAAGLEAMVVGEAEIAGQVRAAVAEARRDGTVTARLDRLFGNASRAARRVASTTELGAAGRSVVGVALDLVEAEHVALAGRRVCLIGTGAFARIAHAELLRRDAGELLLYSLSGRAARFAETHPGTVVAQAELGRALAAADVIVSCSGAPHPVVDTASLAAVRDDAARRLAILDLALTRDVEHGVRALEGVRVYDLDDVARHAPPAHHAAVVHARDVVERSVADFVAVEAGRSADPAIRALRAHVMARMTAELERVEQRHPANVAAAVTGALDRFAAALLHAPTVRIRELVQQGRGAEALAALDLLFGLEGAPLDEDGPDGRPE